MPPQDTLVQQMRRSLRSALLRYKADHAVGREAEDLRAVGERLSALLVEKQTHSPDAVTDMEFRAALAVALAAELDALAAGEGG